MGLSLHTTKIKQEIPFKKEITMSVLSLGQRQNWAQMKNIYPHAHQINTGVPQIKRVRTGRPPGAKKRVRR